jgi:3-hydroxyacyl-[acyl-carrier-protein] dehydratase
MSSAALRKELITDALSKLKSIEEKIMIHKLSHEEIKELIPHRHPFLLIDTIEELELGKRVVAIKNISGNDPVFQGHFPHKPIYPGVLLIESMAQACVCLISASLKYANAMKQNMNFYFSGIENAKFRQVVLPGEQLKIEGIKVKDRGSLWVFETKIYSGETLKVEALVKAMAVIES